MPSPAHNPFRVARLHALPFQPQGWDWDDLFAAFKANGHHGLIVGPEGSGKTTLLFALPRLLRTRGFRSRLLRLRCGQRRLAPNVRHHLERSLRLDDLLLVDGGEQLGFLGWWEMRSLARRAGGILMTSHVVGRLPVLVRCTTSPDLLRKLVLRLDPHGLADETDMAQLLARHRGNVRNALRELYDRHSQRR